MIIKREDIDKGAVDFSDVRSGRRLPPVHPGTILRDEFLTSMEISVYELAKARNGADFALGAPDHLTPAQRRAYVIADNKFALNAGWNEELLASELQASCRARRRSRRAAASAW